MKAPEEILNIARKHLQSVGTTMPEGLSPHWGRCMDVLRTDIEQATNAFDLVNRVLPRIGSYDHRRRRSDPRYDQLASTAKIATEAEFKISHLACPFEEPAFVAEHSIVDEKRYSSISHWHNFQAVAIFKWVPNVSSIGEIGSGYGSLARLCLLGRPEIKYSLYDLPESLAIAEVYLRLSFPWASFGYNEASADQTFNFFPSPSPRDMQKHDLICNFASFCEMPQKTLDGWVQKIKESGTPRFLSLNYDDEVPDRSHSANFHPTDMDPEARVLRNPALPRLDAQVEWLLAYCNVRNGSEKNSNLASAGAAEAL